MMIPVFPVMGEMTNSDKIDIFDENTPEEIRQGRIDCLRKKLARMKKEGKTKEQVYADYRIEWNEEFKDLDPKIKEGKRKRLNERYTDLNL